jgi:hypothetical protein
MAAADVVHAERVGQARLEHAQRALGLLGALYGLPAGIGRDDFNEREPGRRRTFDARLMRPPVVPDELRSDSPAHLAHSVPRLCAGVARQGHDGHSGIFEPRKELIADPMTRRAAFPLERAIGLSHDGRDRPDAVEAFARIPIEGLAQHQWRAGQSLVVVRAKLLDLLDSPHVHRGPRRRPIAYVSARLGRASNQRLAQPLDLGAEAIESLARIIDHVAGALSSVNRRRARIVISYSIRSSWPFTLPVGTGSDILSLLNSSRKRADSVR